MADVSAAVVDVLRFSGMDPESDHFGPPVMLLRADASMAITEIEERAGVYGTEIDASEEEETRA